MWPGTRRHARRSPELVLGAPFVAIVLSCLVSSPCFSALSGLSVSLSLCLDPLRVLRDLRVENGPAEVRTGPSAPSLARRSPLGEAEAAPPSGGAAPPGRYPSAMRAWMI